MRGLWERRRNSLAFPHRFTRRGTRIDLELVKGQIAVLEERKSKLIAGSGK